MTVSVIAQIAQTVREELEDKYGSDYTGFQGKCVEASELIAARLKERGIEHRIVCGWIQYDDASGCSNRDYDEHTWVEVGDIFVDVTLTQFEPFMYGPLPKVCVGEKPKFLLYDEPEMDEEF
jgi:hypothetical protein